MAAEQRGVLCGGRDHHCGGHAGLFLTLRASSCFILASRGRSDGFLQISHQPLRQVGQAGEGPAFISGFTLDSGSFFVLMDTRNDFIL